MKTYNLPNFETPITADSVTVSHKVLDDTIERTITVDVYFHFAGLKYCLSQITVPYSPTWDDKDVLGLVMDFIDNPENGYIL